MERNRGVEIKYHRFDRDPGIAGCRQQGIDLCGGDFIVLLDDDDELAPGALERFAGAFHEDPTISVIASHVKNADDGSICGDEAIQGVYSYQDIISGRIEGAGELFFAYRREVFDRLRLDERATKGIEILYHMDVFKNHDIRILPEALRIYHHDSRLRLGDLAGMMRNVAERTRALECLLEEHGDAWHENSPGIYGHYLLETAIHHMISGNTRQGNRLLLESFRYRATAKQVILLLLSFLGSDFLRFALKIKIDQFG